MNKKHVRSIQHDEGNLQPLIRGLGETSCSNVERRESHDMLRLQFPVLCGTYLHKCATASLFNDTDNFLLHFTIFWHCLPANAAVSLLVNKHTHEDTLWWWTFYLPWKCQNMWKHHTELSLLSYEMPAVAHSCKETAPPGQTRSQPQHVTCHRYPLLLPRITCPSRQRLHTCHHHEKYHLLCFSFRTTIWSQIMAIPVGTVTQPFDIRSGKYLTKLRHRSTMLAQTI
jgi:hypothetical protein